jgi:hypothetical protein
LQDILSKVKHLLYTLFFLPQLVYQEVETFHQNVQIASGAHTAFNSMSIGILSLEKAAGE